MSKPATLTILLLYLLLVHANNVRAEEKTDPAGHIEGPAVLDGQPDSDSPKDKGKRKMTG